MSKPPPEDHPAVMSWLHACYKQGPGGLVVVPFSCTVQIKSGKRYLAPAPGGPELAHLRREGEDEDGRPLYCSI